MDSTLNDKRGWKKWRLVSKEEINGVATIETTEKGEKKVLRIRYSSPSALLSRTMVPME